MKEKEQKNLCETAFRLFGTGVDLQKEHNGGKLVRWRNKEASPEGEKEQKNAPGNCVPLLRERVGSVEEEPVETGCAPGEKRRTA